MIIFSDRKLGQKSFYTIKILFSYSLWECWKWLYIDQHTSQIRLFDTDFQKKIFQSNSSIFLRENNCNNENGNIFIKKYWFMVSASTSIEQIIDQIILAKYEFSLSSIYYVITQLTNPSPPPVLKMLFSLISLLQTCLSPHYFKRQISL